LFEGQDLSDRLNAYALMRSLHQTYWDADHELPQVSRLLAGEDVLPAHF
jgi:hypothetical protein